jgi:hypothetical protein
MKYYLATKVEKVTGVHILTSKITDYEIDMALWLLNWLLPANPETTKKLVSQDQNARSWLLVMIVRCFLCPYNCGVL